MCPGGGKECRLSDERLPDIGECRSEIGFGSADSGRDISWQNEDTSAERCRRNALNARAASRLHVSAG